MEQDKMGWDSIGWHGIERDGMGWHRIRLNATGVGGMGMGWIPVNSVPDLQLLRVLGRQSIQHVAHLKGRSTEWAKARHGVACRVCAE